MRIKDAHLVQRRTEAEYPVDAAEACNQLRSVDSVLEGELQWGEVHCTVVLDNFLEEEGEDHCCIDADIAGEVVEHSRIYFQISYIPSTGAGMSGAPEHLYLPILRGWWGIVPLL
jgi:hypothetical protein